MSSTVCPQLISIGCGSSFHLLLLSCSKRDCYVPWCSCKAAVLGHIGQLHTHTPADRDKHNLYDFVCRRAAFISICPRSSQQRSLFYFSHDHHHHYHDVTLYLDVARRMVPSVAGHAARSPSISINKALSKRARHITQYQSRLTGNHMRPYNTFHPRPLIFFFKWGDLFHIYPYGSFPCVCV